MNKNKRLGAIRALTAWLHEHPDELATFVINNVADFDGDDLLQVMVDHNMDTTQWEDEGEDEEDDQVMRRMMVELLQADQASSVDRDRNGDYWFKEQGRWVVNEENLLDTVLDRVDVPNDAAPKWIIDLAGEVADEQMDWVNTGLTTVNNSTNAEVE